MTLKYRRDQYGSLKFADLADFIKVCSLSKPCSLTKPGGGKFRDRPRKSPKSVLKLTKSGRSTEVGRMSGRSRVEVGPMSRTLRGLGTSGGGRAVELYCSMLTPNLGTPACSFACDVSKLPTSNVCLGERKRPRGIAYSYVSMVVSES